jgi:hypothetical protein
MTKIGKILTLLAVSCPLLVVACAARVRVHDYMFEVTGLVAAEDNTPIEGAEVTLEVNGPVYEAVTLVRTVKSSTNNAGGFVFAYLSHKRGVNYGLTVRKEGFEPQTVSGSAPPDGHHTIRLKRASG